MQEAPVDDPDFEWLMADYVVRRQGNVHIRTAAGYRGRLRQYPRRQGRYALLPGAVFS